MLTQQNAVSEYLYIDLLYRTEFIVGYLNDLQTNIDTFHVLKILSKVHREHGNRCRVSNVIQDVYLGIPSWPFLDI